MSKSALLRTKSFQLIVMLALALGVGIALAIDSDNDGMSDLYENFFKLNATNGTDAVENYDSDTLNNLQESVIWTDPMVSDTDADGFPDHADSNALSRAVMMWGDPNFTDGDVYRYTGPLWWLGAGKSGGEWGTNNCWTVPPLQNGSLYIDFDRALLTNDVIMEFRYLDASNTVAQIDLLAADGVLVASNLFGNLVQGCDMQVYHRYPIPLSHYPNASRLLLTVQSGSESYEAYTSVFSIDEDVDGLDQDQEVQVGTLDTNADTDEDTLTDYAEVFITHTDPLKIDTDGDHLSDGAEVVGTLYQMVPGSFTWFEAKADAERLGGHLAVITSDEEQARMFQSVGEQAFYNDHLWLGAEDLDGDGQWAWVTGEPFEYTRWAGGRPDTKPWAAFYNRNFTRNGQGQLWFDGGPHARRPYILEINVSPDPLKNDTDDDELSDSAEILTGSNPLVADTDGDGIPDGEEVALGLDPSKADSDGDTLSDSEEVDAGTDPLKPDTDGDGLSDSVEVRGTVYLMIPGSYTWFDAKDDAERLGGHLAVITSKVEHEQLVQSVGLQAFEENHIWIGAQDFDGDGQWAWVTGESFLYTNWASERPAASPWAAFFNRSTTLNDEGQLWFDGGPHAQRPYLLEINANLNPLLADTDADGLADGDEILGGTDPSLADTDSDGINDGDEVAAGLDPLNADTDGDGITDPQEAEFGTDPLKWDTDDDGLSDQTELAASVYTMIPGLHTWFGAKAHAEELGGHLAVITGDDEQSRLFQCVGEQAFIEYHLWLGAEDLDGDGQWSWVTGEPFAYTRWAEGRPQTNAWAAFYNRIFSLNGQGRLWFDGGPHAKRPYLLEWPGPLDPLNSDVDGDGLSDGDELLIYRSNPVSADTDHDGLTDAEEVALGTQPSLSDSDGDGLSDPVELAGATDPRDPDCDDDGLLDGMESHMVYVRRFLTWPQAMAEAEARGGHLVTLSSEAEQAEVDAIIDFDELANKMPWIGARVAELGGSWQWVDGTPFTYQNWYTDEFGTKPDDPGRAIYLSYFRGTAWDDRQPDRYQPYIMEYPQSLDPWNPDADNDGLSDGDEVNIYRSGPFMPDTDGDGILDGDEVAAGLNPCSFDTDRDALLDSEESEAGLDPLVSDMDGDGLRDGYELLITKTDPLLADSNQNGVNDLTVVTNIPGSAAVGWLSPHISTVWSMATNGAVLSRANNDARISYRLPVGEAGVYHLHIQTDLAADMIHADLQEPKFNVFMDGILIIEALSPAPTITRPEYALFTPWLAEGQHLLQLVVVEGGTGQAEFTLERIDLGWVDGEDADGDGVQDWMKEFMDPALDTDGDGLSDRDEIFVYGSDPLNVDTDGDQLDDGAEVAYGTDLLDTDSDDDGVSDGAEVLEAMANPLNADFDGTINDVSTLNGNQFTNEVGSVETFGASARIKPMRGSVEYVFNVTEGDVYRLAVSAAHEWLGDERPAESRIEISIDGLYIGTKTLDTDSMAFEDLVHFLPWLNPGQHTIKLYWDNYDENCTFLISQIRLQEMGGPDGNNNGIKDWVESYLNQVTGIDAVSKSFISPACIEGDARHVPFMSITGGAAASMPEVRQGAGNRWYANLPLQEDSSTEANVSFQNGGKIRALEMVWTPYNLIEHNGEILRIRKDDTLRLTCIDPDRAAEDLEMATGGQFLFALDVSGEVMESPNTRPIAVSFTNAGIFTVSGEYTRGNETMVADVTIEVISGSFPEENPACMPERPRLWICPDLPTNAVIEADETVEIVQGVETVEIVETALDGSLSTNCLQQTAVSLAAHQTLGEHWLVARLFKGGPILDNTRVDVCWSGASLEGYATVVGSYDDSEIWEMVITARNLPPGVEIHLDSIAAGVLFADDYSTSRTITSADLNNQGDYVYRMIVPHDVNHSACHTVKMYQDGVYIGTAFSAGEFNGGQ